MADSHDDQLNDDQLNDDHLKTMGWIGGGTDSTATFLARKGKIMAERIPIGSLTLNVEQRGEGPPLLLVHGFPFNHTSWQPQIDELSDRCRIIAPDLRGFGLSDVVEGVTTMQQFADDLAALLDALRISEPITLCGLSMGGYIAWQFWARHGSRLGRLILCDTRAAADLPMAAEARRANARRVLDEGLAEFASGMVPKLFAAATLEQQPALVESILTRMRSSPAHGVAAALLGMAERPDMTPRLPEINIPALLLCGTHDALTPADEMRSIAATLPQAQFVEVPHAGHLAPLENPQAVNAAIREFVGAA